MGYFEIEVEGNESFNLEEMAKNVKRRDKDSVGFIIKFSSKVFVTRFLVLYCEFLNQFKTEDNCKVIGTPLSSDWGKHKSVCLTSDGQAYTSILENKLSLFRICYLYDIPSDSEVVEEIENAKRILKSKQDFKIHIITL